MFRTIPFIIFTISVTVACKTQSTASGSKALAVDSVSSAGAFTLPVAVPADSGTLEAGIRLTPDGHFSLSDIRLTTTQRMQMGVSMDTAGRLRVTAATRPDTLQQQARAWATTTRHKSEESDSRTTSTGGNTSKTPLLLAGALIGALAVCLIMARRK